MMPLKWSGLHALNNHEIPVNQSTESTGGTFEQKK